MASKTVAVKVTANFETNLAAIEAFQNEADALKSYDALLNALNETVIPNLERFPDMGRPFPARRPRSVEARIIMGRLSDRIGSGEIREYLIAEYLLLYAVVGNVVYLVDQTSQATVFRLSSFLA